MGHSSGQLKWQQMPHVGQLNLSLLLTCRSACRGCQQSKRSHVSQAELNLFCSLLNVLFFPFSSMSPLAVMAVVSRTSPQGLSSHQPGLPALCALRQDSAGVQQVLGGDKIHGYFANYTLNSPWDLGACIQGYKESVLAWRYWLLMIPGRDQTAAFRCCKRSFKCS